MRGAIRDREAVDSGRADELNGDIRVGIHVVIGQKGARLVDASHVADLRLDGGAVDLGELNDLARDARVLLGVVGRGVAHDAREALVQAALEVRDVAAVVEVDRHGDVGGLRHLDDRAREDVAVEERLHVVLEQIDDDRGIHLLGRGDDAARRLQVERVDGHDGIALGVGLCEHALHRLVHALTSFRDL